MRCFERSLVRLWATTLPVGQKGPLASWHTTRLERWIVRDEELYEDRLRAGN
jgi:hypothetical protein